MSPQEFLLLILWSCWRVLAEANGLTSFRNRMGILTCRNFFDELRTREDYGIMLGKLGVEGTVDAQNIRALFLKLHEAELITVNHLGVELNCDGRKVAEAYSAGLSAGKGESLSPEQLLVEELGDKLRVLVDPTLVVYRRKWAIS